MRSSCATYACFHVVYRCELLDDLIMLNSELELELELEQALPARWYRSRIRPNSALVRCTRSNYSREGSRLIMQSPTFHG